MAKIKISDFAKDLNMSAKDLVAFIQKVTGVEKKTAGSIEESEFNVILDKLTAKNSVKSFDEYFATGAEASEKKAAERQAEKDKKFADQMAILEQLRAAQAAQNGSDKKEEAKEEKKPVKKEEKKEEKPQPKKEEKKAEPKKEQTDSKPKEKAQEKKEEVKEFKTSDPNPFKKREKKENAGAAPNRGPAEIRRVDTRTNTIDMEKYNEKYENIAPANSMKDNFSKKQKIRQKSQDYRRPQGAKRETEADKLRRLQLEKIKKTPILVTVGDEITVGELAEKLKKTAAEVIKTLMKLGMMASVNQVIDYDTAEIVVTEMGGRIEKQVVVTIEDRIMDDTEDTEDTLKHRDPVIVVMGHVDHGKTSILDAIRKSSVASGEAGGITQHIGAYRVNYEGNNITFLDTPGHSAFTAMRLRGAMATDIAVLVVAADDGIMPQTIEAINHAKAANVQIIVAINKMDKPEANPDRILQQLTEHELVPEKWGGDVICVPVSAKTGEGIDTLLENILLVADVMELKANPDRRAKGIVIEARLDKGRGPVATLLVQGGTLRPGDIIVAGTTVGRVRTMTNENGKALKEAGPSVPVEITGLTETPAAGDSFDAVSDERLARELVEQRKAKIKEEEFNAATKVTLDNLFGKLSEGDLKELGVIIKADVQGSVEAVKDSLVKLSNDEVRVKVLHGGVGAINESDVVLAGTGGAIIVGFNVRPDPVAKELAERDGVDIRLYRVIYDCIDEIEAAMKGMLAPKTREVVIGDIEVRDTYKISNVGTIAGCYVTSGRVTRNASIRVVRDGIVVAEDAIASLRRFKDDVKEVAQGYECGISLEKFGDIKIGDVFEAYIIEEYRD
ncbi:MAG: translation initiation factor IF-2 [Acutalibacteraceae bacterium]|nr:translation initiation factor IF-2 [Acutalibacteraceae bacterium]